MAVKRKERAVMPKAMIITVGGSPEPLVKALSKFRPEFVSFLASQRSIDQVPSIKESVRAEGHAILTSENTLIDNVDDLFHCYQKAEEAVNRVLAKGYAKDDVSVDYTGGTKNMSVALSLASVVHGFTFSYVGGTERTKNGLGTVVGGHEVVHLSVNPWDFLGIEERRHISVLFNACQFSAAGRLIEDLTLKSTKHKPLFKKLGFAIHGYYHWDMFKHAEALGRFEKAKLDELFHDDLPGLRSFASETAMLTEFLRRVIEKSEKGRKPCAEIIADLYANAERRHMEGKIDDAVLRLYRALEMIAQDRLAIEHGIMNSDVPEKHVPEALREEFSTRYRDKNDGKIKLPLTASFRLLKELGSDMGALFLARQSDFSDLQSSRNYSYLAHGFVSAKNTTYTRFREFLVGLRYIELAKVPRFPQLIF
jgi:CRISPR-associated protein (TIGR02710 family)